MHYFCSFKMASNNSLLLRSVLEKDNGANFINSSENLRNVLKQEKRLEVPNQALPNEQEMFQEQVRHERFMTTKALIIRTGKGKGEEGKGKAKPKPKDKVGPWSKGKGRSRLGPIHRRRACVPIATMKVIVKGIAHYTWKN